MRRTLINARKKKKLSQKTRADLLKITERHYRLLETGTSDGSIKIWIQLKQILGISIDDLLEQVAVSK